MGVMADGSRFGAVLVVRAGRRPHLVFAAFLAISLRRSALSFFALAGPPFFPPSRPKATAAGFLYGPARSAVRTASAQLRSIFNVMGSGPGFLIGALSYTADCTHGLAELPQRST